MTAFSLAHGSEQGQLSHGTSQVGIRHCCSVHETLRPIGRLRGCGTAQKEGQDGFIDSVRWELVPCHRNVFSCQGWAKELQDIADLASCSKGSSPLPISRQRDMSIYPLHPHLNIVSRTLCSDVYAASAPAEYDVQLCAYYVGRSGRLATPISRESDMLKLSRRDVPSC